MPDAECRQNTLTPDGLTQLTGCGGGGGGGGGGGRRRGWRKGVEEGGSQQLRDEPTDEHNYEPRCRISDIMNDSSISFPHPL